MENQEIDSLNLSAWQDKEGNLQSSYTRSLELLAISEKQNYHKGIADSCKTLGYCFWRFSDYSLSLYHSLKALKIYEAKNSKWDEADTLNNIGAVYMFQKNNKKRLEVNIKCKKIRQQVGDLEGVSSSEGNIGETYFEMGELDKAVECFNNVLKDKNSSPEGLAWAYYNLGRSNETKQEIGAAISYYQKGLETSLSVNYNVLITDSYLALGNIYVNSNLELALENAELALNVSKKIGAKESEKEALLLLSKIAESNNQYQDSLKYHKSYHEIANEIINDSEIEALKTTQLQVAFEKIEAQKNQLVDSIKYAEQIQKAALKIDTKNKYLSNYFVLNKPKDIVSGDFYWSFENDANFYACVADCTGHGVPGAFLTLLGITFLNVIAANREDYSPSEILNELRNKIIDSLSQSENAINKDGLDISLIKIEKHSLKAEWSGAYNPLILIRQNSSKLTLDAKHKLIANDKFSLIEIKGDKQPVSISREMKGFTNHQFQLQKDDIIFLYSDGFSDQFGGKKGKKYMSSNLKKLLLEIQNQEISKQKELLETAFNKWKGEYNQVDDVCVFAFKL